MNQVGCTRLIGILAVLLFGTSARLAGNTVSLAFTPNQTVLVGGAVDVALTISGLGSGSGASLGGYDLEIAYDPLILGDPTVAFGDPSLGDQLSLTTPSYKCTGLKSGCGLSSMPLEIVELSFDPKTALDAAQAGTFTLATIGFKAIGPGTSDITLSHLLLSDASGGDLSGSFHIELSDGVVNAVGVAAIPEPNALPFFTFGLVGMLLAWRSLRARKRQV